MSTLFLAGLLIARTGAQDAAPGLPLGSSGEFQATAYKVETLLEQGKFAEAAKLADRLPKRQFTLHWDSNAIPARMKSVYLTACNEAIQDWGKFVKGLQVRISDKGEVKVGFKETLPPPPDGVFPAGAAFFTSDSESEPRIEAVIALKRDTPPVAIGPRQVQNEVGYAIGAYLGLARNPRVAGYMGRIDTLADARLHGNLNDGRLAEELLAFADTLRDAAKNKVKLKATKPTAMISPTVLKHADMNAGDPLQFTVEVSNRGNSPLLLKAVPECGCIHLTCPPKVMPGQVGVIYVDVDTSLFPGAFNKAFEVFTNDPDTPNRRIPIVSRFVPAYQFISPAGGNFIVMDDVGSKQDVFLAINPSKPFKVKSVKVTGIPGAAEFAPWEGVMADPMKGEDALPRKGYKISFLLSPTQQKGRIPAGVVVETDSPENPSLIATFSVQWGILVEPERIYFGEIPKKDYAAYFVVNRPGKPFKITSVSSDNEFISASYDIGRGGGYKVTVLLSEKAPFGELTGNVTLKTDDPKQPVLVVPVRAVFK